VELSEATWSMSPLRGQCYWRTLPCVRLLLPLVAGSALLCGCGGGAGAGGGTPCPAVALVGLVRVDVPRTAVAAGRVTATLCLEGACAPAGVSVTAAQLAASRPMINPAPKMLVVRVELREHGQVVLTASGRVPTRQVADGSGPCARTAVSTVAHYDSASRSLKAG